MVGNDTSAPPTQSPTAMERSYVDEITNVENILKCIGGSASEPDGVYKVLDDYSTPYWLRDMVACFLLCTQFPNKTDSKKPLHQDIYKIVGFAQATTSVSFFCFGLVELSQLHS